MKDINGIELKVGDKVCYVHGKNASARLKVGTVTKIYEGGIEGEECSVDGNAHIYHFRVMKIGEND